VADNTMSIALVYHPDYLKHDTGTGHPERPQRLTWIMKRLEEDGLLAHLALVEPQPAARAVIEAVHPADYIDWVQARVAQAPTSLDPDTPVSHESFNVAMLAAGGAVAAVDAVCDGSHQRAFVLPRPPGHHATAIRAMGFCLLNNIAIAARYAQQRHGASRVAIIDWDVHHGNGTQDIFYDDPSVLYCSLHQYPYYPGTGHPDERGAGPADGTTLNCPMASGSRDDDYIKVFEETVLPHVHAFRPDLLFISAGFDGHRDDPLASIELTETGFARLTDAVVQVAAETCQGRIVSVLEGGYHPRALPASVATHIQQLHHT
jgi:acetoin utilization deacetylase AcuC-like enzyme